MNHPKIGATRRGGAQAGLRKIKTNDMPAFNAYILICLLQIFNIVTITTVINYFLKMDMKRDIAIYTGLG